MAACGPARAAHRVSCSGNWASTSRSVRGRRGFEKDLPNPQTHYRTMTVTKNRKGKTTEKNSQKPSVYISNKKPQPLAGTTWAQTLHRPPWAPVGAPGPARLWGRQCGLGIWPAASSSVPPAPVPAPRCVRPAKQKVRFFSQSFLPGVTYRQVYISHKIPEHSAWKMLL